MRRNKWNAKPTWRDGHYFHSLWEADRYTQLKYLQMAGEISDLEWKKVPTFSLHDPYKCKRTGKLVKSSTYQPDFTYIENGERVWEDAKGSNRRESNLKRKIVESRHDVIIWFVYRDGSRK